MPNARIVNTPAQAIRHNATTHQQITVSSTANDLETLGSFTFTSGTTHVLIQVNDAPVRVTFDSGATTPTASVGFRYDAGKEAYWPIALAQSAELIREGAGDATVELQELNYK